MWMWPVMMVMVMVHAIVQAHAVLLDRVLLLLLLVVVWLLVLGHVRSEATRAAPQCNGDFAVQHLEENCVNVWTRLGLFSNLFWAMFS